jgi:putative methionine-R-sulfoxide reductase with GAF domain
METPQTMEKSMDHDDLIEATAGVFSQGDLIAAIYMESYGKFTLKGSPKIAAGIEPPFPQTLSTNVDRMADLFTGNSALIIGEVEEPRADLPGELVTLPLQLKTRSAAYLPIYITDKFSGMVMLFSRGNEAITRSKILPQIEFTQHLSEMLELRDSHQMLVNQLTQLKALNQVSAASSRNLEEALRTTARSLRESMGDRISILLLDPTSGKLEVAAQAGYGEEVLSMKIEPGQGVTGWVARNREAQVVNNVEMDPRYIPGSENVRSEVAVPLIFRDELLGVLNLENDRPSAYTQDNLDILTTVARTIAGIIVNTRLWQRQRQLFDVTNKIRRSPDINSIMETTANELNRVLKTRRAKIEVGMESNRGSDGENMPVESGKGALEK